MKLFKLICHCRPDRSFFINNHQFPVCARCTGIYISALLYVLLYLFFISFRFLVYSNNYIIIPILCIIPCFIDGITQYTGLRESTNFIRVFTGFLAGFNIMWLYTGLYSIIF